MTFTTLRIREYPAAATPAEMEHYATKSKPKKDLDHLTRRCAPHQVASWGKSQGLPVFFVDNEWIRLPVTAAQLAIFARDVLDTSDGSNPMRLQVGATAIPVAAGSILPLPPGPHSKWCPSNAITITGTVGDAYSLASW